MIKGKLSVREMQPADFDNICTYWLTANAEHLTAMGVDTKKIPQRSKWMELLTEQYQEPPSRKTAYYIIWLLDDNPIGHSSINKIIYGKEAYMHLHLWHTDERQRGYGTTLVKNDIALLFQ